MSVYIFIIFEIIKEIHSSQDFFTKKLFINIKPSIKVF